MRAPRVGASAVLKRSPVRRSWAIDQLAEPQLQHQQGPHVSGTVGAMTEVVIDNGAHRARAEVAARHGALREDRVLEQWPQVLAQPLADGNAETHLRARQDLGG